LIPFCISAQNVGGPVKIGNPIHITTPKWIDNDVQLLDHEPYGNIDGVQRNDGVIYIGIADTLESEYFKYYTLFSLDTGKTWTINNSGLLQKIDRHKLICSSNDTVYSIYLRDGVLYCWNVNSIYTIPIPETDIIKNFDAVAGKNGTIHIFYSTITGIKRISSTDGGSTWTNIREVSYHSDFPSLCTNKTGDLVNCSYYEDFTTYNYKSPIFSISYTADATGLLTPFKQSNATPHNDTLTYRSEIHNAIANGKIMILYAEGPHGNINITGSLSADSGGTYTNRTIVNTSFDEYWIDLTSFNDGNGFDVVYYADSLQTGNPNSNTDYLQYNFSPDGINLSGFKKLANHIPFWSPNNYKPKIIELGYEDCGIIWVGLDLAYNKGVYWNRYNAPSAVNDQNATARGYTLNQNYPNPFNPSTTISFSLPKQSNVSLIVYDALGREAAVLVNEVKSAGQYHINFDGKNLSSGVYFYKLAIDGFVQTKKMMLMK
jgi:hypothetical protein